MQGLSSLDDDNGKGSSSSSSSSNRSGGIVKGGFNVENTITLAVLFGLSGVYLYLLTSPDQPIPSVKPRPFVIPSDTRERFEEFLKSYHTENSYEGYDMKSLQESFNDAWTSESLEKDWGSKGNKDDFFYEGRGESEGEGNKGTKYEPNVASTNFRCEEGWVTIRSDTNYKYLWMHSGTDYWMSATATMDTPLHRRAFHIEPVNSDCSEGGWVLMKEGDTHGKTQSIYQSINQSIYLSIYLSICLSIYLSIYLMYERTYTYTYIWLGLKMIYLYTLLQYQ